MQKQFHAKRNKTVSRVCGSHLLLQLVFIILATCLILTGCEEKPSTDDINSDIRDDENSSSTEVSAAYIQIISQIVAQNEEANEYTKNRCLGELVDLNKDGTDELILILYDDGKETFYCEIYSYESDNIVCLFNEVLFFNAGNSAGGISLVDYNDNQYICLWTEYSEAGTLEKVAYSNGLYILSESQMNLGHAIVFNYYIGEQGEALPENSTLLFDDANISFEEFLTLRKLFDEPNRDICTIDYDYVIGKSLESLLIDLSESK